MDTCRALQGNTHILSEREKGHKVLNIQGIMTRLGGNTGEQPPEERAAREAVQSN